MTDIYLAVDTGGSQTKVVYQVRGTAERKYLVMSPFIEQISQVKLQEYMARQGWIGSPAPEQQVWIEWNEQVFVLGAFAVLFDPEDRIRERKYENALYKVLSAIGLIVQKVKLSTKKKLHVQLGVLLPWNEYNDRSLFHEQLKAMLSNFRFQGNLLKVELERFLCRPEGGGVAVTQIRQQGIEWLRENKLGVLMFGHRNTTALYFEHGELKHGDSPLFGFSMMLDRVIELTSGLERDSLAEAIFRGMSKAKTEIYGSYDKNSSFYERDKACTKHPDWGKLEEIKSLASAKNPTLRSKEVVKIASAIDVATKEYWEKLERWLMKVLPESLRLDEVIVCGGAAYFLEPELEVYFNCRPDINYEGKRSGYRSRDSSRHRTDIIWGAGIQEQVKKVFDFDRQEEEEQSLSFRFIDCFGLFDYLIALDKEAKEKERQEKKARAKSKEMANEQS
jgi:hypothetical protein